ncbi:hypothetical protein [Nonlabens xiamenensis]|uniref:hypothetical protein n=1 Tax=Nonlabens xiamenensis TaxID=2341043 RepID=UPI000F614CC4|nr:hypothetical protein [Nonlabens xiamenensis]
MLEIGSKTFTCDGVTVFADHADPDQFWALPAPVQIARRDQDNKAKLTFIKYGNVSDDQVKGGGFLMLETNLRLDKNVERKIMSKITSMAKGTPKLAIVPFDEGTVECIALDLQGGGGTEAQLSSDGTFQAVERILGGTVPSLHGDNSAAFSLKLSKEGAEIVEGAFKQRGNPVGVLYNLKYSGLRPALDVEIKASKKKIYNHFSAGLDAQVYWVRAGIEAGFEKMVEDQVIEIKVINYSTEEDRAEKEKWALDFFKEKMLPEFFKSSLTPGTLAGGMATPESLQSVATQAARLRPPQAATRDAQAADEAEDDDSPAPTPSAPNRPRPDENTGSETEEGSVGSPPAVANAVAGAIASATSMPPQTAAAAPSPPAGAVNTPHPGAAAAAAPALVSFKLKMLKQVEEKTMTFKYTRSEAVQRTYAPQGFLGLLSQDLKEDGYFINIDTDSEFFSEFRVIVEAKFDRQKIGLDSAHVGLKYGNEEDSFRKTKDFVFDQTEQEKVDWLVKKAEGVDHYQYSVQYHFDPDSDWHGEQMSYDFENKSTEDRTLLIHPFDKLLFLEVELSAVDVDWDEIKEARIQLHYKTGSGWENKETFFFRESDNEKKHWKIRSSDMEQKSYTYQVTYLLKDGSERQMEQQTSEASAVSIPNLFKTINIDFIPLFGPDEVRNVFIDIEYEDEENDLVVKERVKMDGKAPADLTFELNILDDAKGTYRYRTTIVGKDNSLQRADFIETKETLNAISLT